MVYGVKGRIRGARFNNVFFFVDGEELYAYYDSASQMYYNDKKIEGVRKVITDPKFFVQSKQVLSEQTSPIDLQGNGYKTEERVVPTWYLDNDLDVIDITYTKAGSGEKMLQKTDIAVLVADAAAGLGEHEGRLMRIFPSRKSVILATIKIATAI